jgi:hypothetical protein
MRFFKNKKEKEDCMKTIMAIGIISLFLGGFGIVLSVSSLALLPFFFGAVNQEEVYGKEDKKTLVERYKGLTPQKKVGLGIAMIFILPFIAIAGMWFMVIGTAYWIDALFVVPIILIVGFLYFYKKERQTHTIGKVLGNPIMGIIGIAIIGFILFSAVSNYYEEVKYEGRSVVEYGKPIVSDPSDYQKVNGTIQYVLDENGQQVLDEYGNPIPILKTIPTLTFRVVDDFFYAINFETNLVQEIDNTTNTATLKDTEGTLEIPNARLSITMNSKDGKELFSVGKRTDAGGLIQFTGVPYGTYVVNVDCGGYFKFSRAVHLNENYDGQIVNVHMMPVYYRVSVLYAYTETVERETNWMWTIQQKSNAYVHLTANYDGGITSADLKNLRRQQSIYGWSGMAVGGVSNSMLQYGQQMSSIQNSWVNWLVLYLAPSLALAGSLSSSVETLTYQGHALKVSDAYLDDSGQRRPIYYRQFPSPNSNKGNATDPETNDTIPISTLKERVYVYSLWTTSNAEGNTFRVQFNVSTFYNRDIASIFNAKNVDEVVYNDVEITFNTELPSMSTEYWRA